MHAEVREYEESFPAGSIIDGVVDVDTYIESKIRVAWFLKEPYSDEKEGYHIKKHYGQDDAYLHFFSKIAKSTWHPVIYASFGILNGFMHFDDQDDIEDMPEKVEIIKHIAIINASKLPSRTGTMTLWKNLREGFDASKSIIEKQVAALQPQIHIFCNTFALYKDFFHITDEDKVEESKKLKHCEYYIKDNKIYIDAYHPANFVLKEGVYVDQIIDAASYWSEQLEGDSV